MSFTFQAIKPGTIIDTKRMQSIITNQMRMVAKSVQVDFVATTLTWKRRPDFVISEPDESTIVIGTDNDIWYMLNVGTRPHIIRIKNAKWLAFRWDGFGTFRAKTVPRQFRSNKGYVGRKWNYRKQVRHPGHKAREYTDAAREKYQRLLPVIIQRAINSAVGG
jgi:hypothetical protein